MTQWDRREDRRYRLRLNCKWKLVHDNRVVAAGTGATVDLSSGGVLFDAQQQLPHGLDVELAINWPVKLLNIHPMQLVVRGPIVRAHKHMTAIRTRFHEFRTQTQR